MNHLSAVHDPIAKPASKPGMPAPTGDGANDTSDRANPGARMYLQAGKNPKARLG